MELLYCKIRKYTVLAATSFILIFLSIIPVRIAITSYQAPYPQAILTLGGDVEREKFTAQFAQQHPHLNIWVSSGRPAKQAHEIFESANISNSRLHLDYRAVDTVTNFTTLVADFQSYKIQHIYLITAAYHIPRAKIIATLILGSRGITFTPVTIPSPQPRESIVRIIRDTGRSILWIVSGRTGASLNPRFHKRSMPVAN
ncbi:YdcF family protein [Anabaena sp. UHCC 0253]|uniref:YdcF family protein n=1 Tax=Anabaena sp. UHCC 0253 TaxID=2590019 RepID=UPI0014462B5A|nr:YdcF family protein [Anabaena sp. UHCC 0253]MTJ53672.1 YdcF family protein [Anabaena sp. UHCC 0253]